MPLVKSRYATPFERYQRFTKHFDLFSGYGGFALACERNGIETIGFSEIDKYASAVLKYHWPNIKNYGDITKINWAGVPDFDLLAGGSPCQDFSISGLRAGISGARSGLFSYFIEALRQRQPKYFIWENVKGAVSSGDGKDFATIINEMAEAGYSLWWQVLNAKDFGVPQNRERIFVVGFRDGSPREVFFERISTAEYSQEVQGVLCPTLKARDYKDGGKWLGEIRRLTPLECERLMGLPDGWTAKGSFPISGLFETDGISPMTPICEDKEISDSQRYKLCGNGVVVNVVEELIKTLILALP